MCIAEGWLKRKIIRKLNEAAKIIYIDPALMSPLKKVRTDYISINNPFDMRDVENINVAEARMRFPQIDHDKIVITIAGFITEEKGVPFLIQAFRELQTNDVVLVIVGEGIDTECIRKCKEEASSTKNIVFLGQQEDMRYVYAITDYIIRADAFFATGRTVYEGLYAGCGVIIQSDNEESDRRKMQEYDRFKDRIYMYKTRNRTDLLDVIESIPMKKITNRHYMSNVEEYINKINSFLEAGVVHE